MSIDTLMPSQRRVILPQIASLQRESSSKLDSSAVKKASKTTSKISDAVLLDRQLERSQEMDTICTQIATLPGIFPSSFVKGRRRLADIQEAYKNYLLKLKEDGLFDALASKTMQRIKLEERFTRDQAAFILGMSSTTLRRNYDDYILRGRDSFFCHQYLLSLTQ